jgi:hypothetical protein
MFQKKWVLVSQFGNFGILWRRGLAQVLLKKCNCLGVKVLVKVNAIEAWGVGTDGSNFSVSFGVQRARKKKCFASFTKRYSGFDGILSLMAAAQHPDRWSAFCAGSELHN